TCRRHIEGRESQIADFKHHAVASRHDGPLLKATNLKTEGNDLSLLSGTGGRRPDLHRWSQNLHFQFGRSFRYPQVPIFAGRHEVPMHYSPSDLEEDRRTLEHLSW